MFANPKKPPGTPNSLHLPAIPDPKRAATLMPEQVRGAIASLSMLSYTGKRSLPRWQRSAL
jgi:hypothetical protein